MEFYDLLFVYLAAATAIWVATGYLINFVYRLRTGKKITGALAVVYLAVIIIFALAGALLRTYYVFFVQGR